ncbi:MAG: GIY-YIG nuclease family protein [candidate division Zixibacteria bacterium]|nr:GIY-YIG nuclease family protein [candidate division Zixibacteria bacterium]MDH3938117.1 GIY-YIG nuclease family protein [candidate division Zixibacteria bacterium]MDH4033508.1 GIY-YIG nuclease family protein [candidate division Zixibacteria bacterium]
MSYYLYILQSEAIDRLYIGVTGDLKNRIKRHNQGRSLSTKSARPWKVVHTEEFNTRSEAMMRESQLKKWKNKDRLKQLIKLGASTSE